MKTIIAGSRTIKNYVTVLDAIIKSKFDITEVVSGTAKGVDELGEVYAKINNIPIKQFPADWETHGRSAGFIRNSQMAIYADALIAIWDGKSRGTEQMIKEAKKRKLAVFLYTIP